MRVFIAHGEADQAIADELKEYLKPHGFFAETETGARGFRHLQKSDVVIALWSRNALFTASRMMLEKRMLDAWADGQLILVKLDHNFLPVGMRDLPAIDATFEHARATTAWRDIARQARERINALLVQQQTPAEEPPPAAQEPPRSPFEPGERSLTSRRSQAPASPGATITRESRTSGPADAHSKSRGNWFLPASAIILILALIGVGANVLMERLSGGHGAATEEEVVETVETPAGQDMRVTADMLTLLQNADLENGAAEAAKCQMCHAFTPDGPVMLGPPLYDLIGKDIASHEGFAYSAGEGGLADVEGVWTYRNLDQFLERPKAIAENTTMFFVGERRPAARADLIAYLRTLAPGELAPLPEALPPGVTYDGEATETAPDTPTETGGEAESEDSDASGPMRQLEEASNSMLQQPLLIAGTALVLLALMIFVIRINGGSRNKSAPQLATMELDTDEVEEESNAPEGASLSASEVIDQIADADGDLVFISYAHDDNERVEPVVRIVKSNGREVWIDKRGIQAGDGWAGEIVRAIKSAGGVMVMCSKSAFESDHIKREIYLADRYKKQILPIFLEEAHPPEDFEYFFAGVQWLELFRLPEADRPGAIGRALAAV